MPNRGWIFVLALAAILVSHGCAPKMVKTVAIGDPRAALRVLISSESSDFKQAVIEQVVAGYDKRDLYFRITDLQNLADETAADYTAVIIINSCVAWQLNPRANAFINQAGSLERIILLTTAGNQDWQAGVAGVDAITAASLPADIEQTADKLKAKLGALIHAAG